MDISLFALTVDDPAILKVKDIESHFESVGTHQIAFKEWVLVDARLDIRALIVAVLNVPVLPGENVLDIVGVPIVF